MKKIVFCALLLCVVLPLSAEALIKIQEVMYDPEGTDGGYEWVEIKNTGNTDIDVTQWKLRENGVNHGIHEFQGGVTLVPDAIAVIADNAQKFLSVYPGHAGIVFDSVFSLNNTGEDIELIDEQGNSVDVYTYTAVDTASGTGNSLQLLNSVWGSGTTTPGQDNAHTFHTSTNTEDGDHIGAVESSGEVVTVQVGLDGPRYSGSVRVPQQSLVDVQQQYQAQIIQHRDIGDLTRNDGRFVWNMGDGTAYDLDWNTPIDHTYTSAGDYILVFEFYRSRQKFFPVDPLIRIEKEIVVQATGLAIQEIGEDGSLYLKNTSPGRVDVSGWMLRSRDLIFRFPENSFIPGGETRALSSRVTGFSHLSFISEGEELFILRPQGDIYEVFTYQVEEFDVVGEEEISFAEVVADFEQHSASDTPQSQVRSEALAASLVFTDVPQAAVRDILPWWVFGLLGVGGLLALIVLVLQLGSTKKQQPQRENEEVVV